MRIRVPGWDDDAVPLWVAVERSRGELRRELPVRDDDGGRSDGTRHGLGPGVSWRQLAQHRQALPVGGPRLGLAAEPVRLPGLPAGCSSVCTLSQEDIVWQ